MSLKNLPHLGAVELLPGVHVYHVDGDGECNSVLVWSVKVGIVF